LALPTQEKMEKVVVDRDAGEAHYGDKPLTISSERQMLALELLAAQQGKIVGHADLHRAIVPAPLAGSIAASVVHGKATPQVRETLSALASALKAAGAPKNALRVQKKRGYRLRRADEDPT
jgi:DNA-binding winged helix-turn-helix (wHTH) protein